MKEDANASTCPVLLRVDAIDSCKMQALSPAVAEHPFSSPDDPGVASGHSPISVN